MGEEVRREGGGKEEGKVGEEVRREGGGGGKEEGKVGEVGERSQVVQINYHI